MKNKIVIEILKVVITAIATALGMSVCSGCTVIPFLNF